MGQAHIATSVVGFLIVATALSGAEAQGCCAVASPYCGAGGCYDGITNYDCLNYFYGIPATDCASCEPCVTPSPSPTPTPTPAPTAPSPCPGIGDCGSCFGLSQCCWAYDYIYIKRDENFDSNEFSVEKEDSTETEDSTKGHAGKEKRQIYYECCGDKGGYANCLTACPAPPPPPPPSPPPQNNCSALHGGCDSCSNDPQCCWTSYSVPPFKRTLDANRDIVGEVGVEKRDANQYYEYCDLKTVGNCLSCSAAPSPTPTPKPTPTPTPTFPRSSLINTSLQIDGNLTADGVSLELQLQNASITITGDLRILDGAVFNLSLGSSWSPFTGISPILVNGTFVLDHKSTLAIALPSSFPLSGVAPITAKGSSSLQGNVLVDISLTTVDESKEIVLLKFASLSPNTSLPNVTVVDSQGRGYCAEVKSTQTYLSVVFTSDPRRCLLGFVPIVSVALLIAPLNVGLLLMLSCFNNLYQLFEN